MVKPWAIPALGNAMTRRLQETSVLPIRHRKLANRKSTQTDSVHRLLILLSGIATHEKGAGWDAHEFRFNDERTGLRTED
jgi:hypothetical protein